MDGNPSRMCSSDTMKRLLAGVIEYQEEIGFMALKQKFDCTINTLLGKLARLPKSIPRRQ